MQSGFQPVEGGNDRRVNDVSEKGLQSKTSCGYEKNELKQDFSQVERDALKDILRLFRTERRCASVNGAYSLLQNDTKDFINSSPGDLPV